MGNFSEEKRPRLSLAGAQDKIPVLFKNNQYYLPQGAAPSTHIIKFELVDYKHIPIYEYFLAKLAESVNLPVVECCLKKCNREYFLLIKRYDRFFLGDNKIQRLHQEDFCQALGFGYDKKYQADGGPTFLDCYMLLQRTSKQPIKDVENLLKWQMFNFLAGNSDGHAKNLALIYQEIATVSLAPFYDLVCTRAIARLDVRLALAIGEEFVPGKVNKQHWINLGQECNIQEQYLLSVIREMAEMLIHNLKSVRQQFEDKYGLYSALQRVESVVIKQCSKVLKQW